MKQRVISGIVLAAIAILAITLNIFYGYILSIVIAGFAVMCVYELYKSVEIPVKGIYFAYAILFTVAILLCFIPNYSVTNYLLKVQAVLIGVFVAVSVINAFLSRDGFIKTLVMSLITSLIILAFGIVAYWGTLSIYFGSGKYNPLGLAMIVVTVLAPFASDTMGLFVGRSLGKHKMAPKISPKKSWEGFAGSCIFAPMIIMAFGGIFNIFFLIFDLPCHVNYISLAITGIIGAVVGTFGDLFFSVIKRKMGIKDYGSIIPGHGGVLDRFDSFTFTTAVIFLLYTVYPQFYIV